MAIPPMKAKSPKDWLRKNKNKQVNTGQQTRFVQARKRGFATGARSKYAAKMASAGRSVKAKMVKRPEPEVEKVEKQSHVNPNRMQGGNTAAVTPGEYEKARAYQRKEEIVEKPTKSGFKKFLGKTKGSLLKTIGRRKYNVF